MNFKLDIPEMFKFLILLVAHNLVYGYEKTVITKPPPNVFYKIGHSRVQLFCDAMYEKSLNVTFEWLKDGQSINFTERVYLEKRVSGPSKIISFRNLTLEDAGQYSCHVYTADGKKIISEDTKHGSIGVIAKPEAPVDVKLNGNCVTFVNTFLSWQPSQYFVAPVKDYIIEYAINTRWKNKTWYKYDPDHAMSSRTTVTLSKSKLPSRKSLVFRVTAISIINGEKLISTPSLPTVYRRCFPDWGPPLVNPVNVRSGRSYDKWLSIIWDVPGSIYLCEGFLIGYRKLANGTKFINATVSGNINSWSTTNLGSGEWYEVFVRSMNYQGLGPEPKIHVFTTGKPAITESVKNFKVVKVFSSSVALTWDELSEATGYRIFYWIQNFKVQTMDTNASNSFILTGLYPNAIYRSFIVALSVNRASVHQSNRVEFRTAIGVPEVPKQVQIKVMGSALMLSWDTPRFSYSIGPIVSYLIECYETGMAGGRKITKTVGGDARRMYITKGLESLKYYTVKLAAVSKAGQGKSWLYDEILIGESDRPGKPQNPHVTRANESALNVTFLLPDNYYGGVPDIYKVYYRPEGTNDGEKYVNETFMKKKWLILTNLQNRPYQIWSAGINTVGEGLSSDAVVVPPPKVIPIDRPNDEPFYKKLWFILFVVLIVLLISFLILVWLCFTRRCGRYPDGTISELLNFQCINGKNPED